MSRVRIDLLTDYDTNVSQYTLILHYRILLLYYDFILHNMIFVCQVQELVFPLIVTQTYHNTPLFYTIRYYYYITTLFYII